MGAFAVHQHQPCKSYQVIPLLPWVQIHVEDFGQADVSDPPPEGCADSRPECKDWAAGAARRAEPAAVGSLPAVCLPGLAVSPCCCPQPGVLTRPPTASRPAAMIMCSRHPTALVSRLPVPTYLHPSAPQAASASETRRTWPARGGTAASPAASASQSPDARCRTVAHVTSWERHNASSATGWHSSPGTWQACKAHL